MDYGTFTAQTVGEVVDLVNLFTGREATESDVRGVLHLYALHDAPLDLAAFAQLATDIRTVFSADGTGCPWSLATSVVTGHGRGACDVPPAPGAAACHRTMAAP